MSDKERNAKKEFQAQSQQTSGVKKQLIVVLSLILCSDGD
jgi:hypothetical protein